MGYIVRNLFMVLRRKQRLFPYTPLINSFIITEEKCVYYAVRTEYLNVIYLNFNGFNYTYIKVFYSYTTNTAA